MSTTQLARRLGRPMWVYAYLSDQCHDDHWPYWIEGQPFCGCDAHFGQRLVFDGDDAQVVAR